MILQVYVMANSFEVFQGHLLEMYFFFKFGMGHGS